MHQPDSARPRVASFVRPARWWLASCLLAVLALPAMAVERVLTITAPASVTAGSKVSIPVLARTDAKGEKIGFFHAEYSTDGGATWTGFCYEQNVASPATRNANFTAGAAGTKALVRVRIAFRGGAAGDVDFNGAALKWKDSWEKWQSPPAKIATILVK